MTVAEPMISTDRDEIDARAAHIAEYVEVPPIVQQLAQVDVPALLAEMDRLDAELDKAERGGEELGRTIAYLTGVMTGTVLLGADDAFGMLRALTEHLVEADAIGADQAERVYAGLDKQRAERDRLAGQVTGIEDRVFHAFVDSDVEGVDLNAMTVQELTAFVMTAIHNNPEATP